MYKISCLTPCVYALTRLTRSLYHLFGANTYDIVLQITYLICKKAQFSVCSPHKNKGPFLLKQPLLLLLNFGY